MNLYFCMKRIERGRILKTLKNLLSFYGNVQVMRTTNDTVGRSVQR